jgi:hypothetical protein
MDAPSIYNYVILQLISYQRLHPLKKHCKITYFRWDFISLFCHIVSKIRVMEGL